jgi:hypothetical protein
MASRKSNPDAAGSVTGAAADTVASNAKPAGAPTSAKGKAAAERNQRLAAQLRDNLKKRKELARARKSASEDTT